MIHSSAYIHSTAVVEKGAEIQEHVKIWHFSHVRKGAMIGAGASLGKGVYVDVDVQIGRKARIQNGVSVFQGVRVSPWCFVGPHVIFTNDLYPRAGSRVWSIAETLLRQGASIGAGAIIRCGITLGAYCMIGAGAIVTKSIPEFHLSLGVLADHSHMICACGETSLPLKSDRRELIRPCCREKLDPEMYRGAVRYLEES